MSVFLDTSALLPVFLAGHPHHSASLALFTSCQPATASCAAHSLAEVYSTLTRLPAPFRAAPDQAIRCVEHIARQFRLIALDESGYLPLLEEAAVGNVAGGAVYDFLIAACALRSGAARIYTWNGRDFQPFGEEIAVRLARPPA